MYGMVMSIGWNPFFDNSSKTIEPWLLNEFPEDFYDQELRLTAGGRSTLTTAHVSRRPPQLVVCFQRLWASHHHIHIVYWYTTLSRPFQRRLSPPMSDRGIHQRYAYAAVKRAPPSRTNTRM